ncbi:uncharacterized protein DAT39_020427, partial [Clarias magur]
LNMGSVSSTVTVDNKTPYKWTVCILGYYDNKNKKFIVRPFQSLTETTQFYWKYPLVKLKYGECSESDCRDNSHLWYSFYYKDSPCFTIRESGDRRHIHLDCSVRTYEGKQTTCPNYGKMEDDSQSWRWSFFSRHFR